MLLLYRNWRKMNIRLLKNSSVCIFLYTVETSRQILEDLAFLWMTELTFSCIATVSENCFTSVLHGVWHLWTGKITLHFLVLPQKQYFWCHPTSFLLDLTRCPPSLDPKITILLHQSTKLHQFSLSQSMCSLANCNLFIFSTMGLRGFLADSFTWAFRLSLITLELIIGWVFSTFCFLLPF